MLVSKNLFALALTAIFIAVATYFIFLDKDDLSETLVIMPPWDLCGVFENALEGPEDGMGCADSDCSSSGKTLTNIQLCYRYYWLGSSDIQIGQMKIDGFSPKINGSYVVKTDKAVKTFKVIDEKATSECFELSLDLFYDWPNRPDGQSLAAVEEILGETIVCTDAKLCKSLDAQLANRSLQKIKFCRDKDSKLSPGL